MPSFTFNAAGTWGAMEIGGFIALFFFGVLSLQTYTYFCTFPKDKILLKLTIAFLWMLEFVHTVLICHEIYTITIVYYLNPAGIHLNLVSLIVSVFIGGLINCIVQVTFAIRISAFTAKPYLTIICCFLSILGLAASCFIAVEGLILQAAAAFGPKFGWLITAYMAVEAFVDILIAASLCYFLKRNAPSVFKPTRYIVNSLVRWTVQTGLITSLSAIALLITYQAPLPTNFIWTGIYTVLAKVYSNSLLASLNGRQKLREYDAREEALDISVTGMEFHTNSTLGLSSTEVRTNSKTAASDPSQSSHSVVGNRIIEKVEAF